MSANVLMALLADFMLVWLPAPTLALGAKKASSGLLNVFAGCPDNAFQRVQVSGCMVHMQLPSPGGLTWRPDPDGMGFHEAAVRMRSQRHAAYAVRGPHVLSHLTTSGNTQASCQHLHITSTGHHQSLASPPPAPLTHNPPPPFTLQPGMEPFTLGQRVGAVLRNGIKLFGVGVTASFIGVAVTNTLLQVRSFLDPSFLPVNKAQDVLATSAAYGVYMATSSNLRCAAREQGCSTLHGALLHGVAEKHAGADA